MIRLNQKLLHDIEVVDRSKEDAEDLNEEQKRRIEQLEAIIHALGSDEYTSGIIERVRKGDTYESIASWAQRSLSHPLITLSPQSQQRFNRMLGGDDPNRALTFWTNVGEDPDMIHHLIRLYLTWIQPAHALLDQERFLASFWACSDHDCSSALVNAICAMGCLLDNDRRQDQRQRRRLMRTLHGQFLRETHDHMRDFEEDQTTPYIQTLAIIFLIGVADGDGRRAQSYLRLAVESLMRKEGPGALSNSCDIVPWGIVSLHTYVIASSSHRRLGDVRSLTPTQSLVCPDFPETFGTALHREREAASPAGRWGRLSLETVYDGTRGARRESHRAEGPRDNDGHCSHHVGPDRS